MAEEDDSLVETSFENSIHFQNAWSTAGCVEDFLHREEYIGVRGTCLDDPEELIYEYDIDGITILWKNVANGLSLDFTHFDLASRGGCDLRPIYPLLKKHIELQEYTEISLKVLRSSLGCQLIYYGGWETWLGFIPKATCHIRYESQDIQNLTKRYVSALKIQFQKELVCLLERDIAFETLAKNNIYVIKKMFILPHDRMSILKAFQRALENTTDDLTASFYPVIFSFRFGEKCRSRIKLPIFDVEAVYDICIHAGICISSYFHDLFWCRNGVNEVIGERGNLSSAFSFFECVNFQSNLDHRSLDVTGLLRSISKFPERVRFIQMYSDIAHRRPSAMCHPISRSIIMVEGILAGPGQQKLSRESVEYLSEMKSNFSQVRQGNCRLEFVVCLTSVEKIITALDVVNTDSLLKLLRDQPMVAPFSKIYDFRVMDCLREVGLYLQSKLQDIYSTRKGTGDSWAVWNAYQYELACEKLLWGHPFSYSSTIYAKNLGPGLDYPSRSLTDQLGFLCLENCFTCCSDENSTPPLKLFTKNQKTQTQISRLFGIADLVNASATALGTRIILCLLKDLHAMGSVFIRFEDFLLLLKARTGNDNKRLVGGVTTKHLLETFINAKKCKWPMVFKPMQQLINDNSKLEYAMKQGINNLKLGYFPAVRKYDTAKHEGLNLRYTYGFWALSDIEDVDSVFERNAGSCHIQILSELERRKICHTSTYENEVFQWIKPCLEKLAQTKLSMEDTLIILTFVTSICLLMNNKYIDFLNLSRLERQLPITQRKLQSLEILSKFKLECVKTVNVLKLHPSIPHHLSNKRKIDQTIEQTDNGQENEEFNINELETEVIPNEGDTDRGHVIQVQSRHIPTNASRTVASWKPEETMILTRFIGVDKNIKQLYEEYRKECRDYSIPDHPFDSFRRKLDRVRKA